MARPSAFRRSRMMQSGVEYLNERYPGIVDDCIEYRHERLASGEERITLTVIIRDSKSVEVR